MSYREAFAEFVRDATNGAEIWYCLTESELVAGKFHLIPPAPNGRPWIYVGAQSAIDELLARFPAVQKSYDDVLPYVAVLP